MNKVFVETRQISVRFCFIQALGPTPDENGLRGLNPFRIRLLLGPRLTFFFVDDDDLSNCSVIQEETANLSAPITFKRYKVQSWSVSEVEECRLSNCNLQVHVSRLRGLNKLSEPIEKKKTLRLGLRQVRPYLKSAPCFRASQNQRRTFALESILQFFKF